MPLMPNPISSPLVEDIQSEGIPPDVIVVRGYLGPPHDVLEQARRILEVYQAAGITQIQNADMVADIAAVEAANAGPLGTRPANAPWRIYLSAVLDCWVEIEDWATNVVRVFDEVDSDRRESHTVWLRLRRDEHDCPIHYRVVTVSQLSSHDGFLSGKLVEDFMSQPESANVVWDEQQYGPTTGKSSRFGCF